MGRAALAFSAEKGGAALSQLSRTLTAPMGRNFDSEFRPDLTPKEMLALGVFCGKYMTDCREEFPASWFAHARCSPSGRDCSLNYFGVDASQPLSVWRSKGWIHPDDPRGWFQWYCRYYMGRRMPEEDARQIKRWKAIRRHIAQIKRHCETGDPTCRPRQRQTAASFEINVQGLLSRGHVRYSRPAEIERRRGPLKDC